MSPTKQNKPFSSVKAAVCWTLTDSLSAPFSAPSIYREKKYVLHKNDRFEIIT